MAYQNVSTPRIYLNIPEYLASTGTTIDPIFRTLPVSANTFSDATFTIPSGLLGTKCFIAVLGHTLYSDNFDYVVTTNDEEVAESGGTSRDDTETSETLIAESLVDVINGTPASSWSN